MKVVADCGNAEYFKTRAIEAIRMTPDASGLRQAIGLLALAIAEAENENTKNKNKR